MPVSGRRPLDLLVATQKGALTLRGDAGRRAWKVEGLAVEVVER